MDVEEALCQFRDYPSEYQDDADVDAGRVLCDEVERLRAALEHYADDEAWCRSITGGFSSDHEANVVAKFVSHWVRQIVNSEGRKIGYEGNVEVNGHVWFVSLERTIDADRLESSNGQ